MKIVKAFLFFSLLFGISSQNQGLALTLADKLKKSHEGDFIVTEQDKTYSLLAIRSIYQDRLLLEEIAAPVSVLSRTPSWQTWISEGAPGHTSWIMYEIDMETCSLIEAYSFTKKGFLFLDHSQHFLSRLLSLNLRKVPDLDRKKTGPAPHADEIDRRKIWNPTVKINGIKTKIECDAWKTVWPKDDSLLSGCHLQLYFGTGQTPFELPFWIEASNGHYTHAIKTVDSGRGLSSPIRGKLPRRTPKLTLINKSDEIIRFTLKSPAYYTHFQLFAFDIIKPYENIGPFSHLQVQSAEKEVLFLDVSQKEIDGFLKKGHRYKWIIIPQGSDLVSIESEDFFQWPKLASK